MLCKGGLWHMTSVTDPRGGLYAYAYAYDGLQRLIRETDQGLAQVNYTLDAQGNKTTYTDPRTLATTYSRNGFGDVKRRTSPDSGITDTVYDLRPRPQPTCDQHDDSNPHRPHNARWARKIRNPKGAAHTHFAWTACASLAGPGACCHGKGIRGYA
jgi:YD repeat-containing protein